MSGYSVPELMENRQPWCTSRFSVETKDMALAQKTLDFGGGSVPS